MRFVSFNSRRHRSVVVAVVLERAKVEVLAQAVTAFLKKPRDEKVLVEVDSALKAVTANKQMAGTVATRVHLVPTKVLAEEAEVLVGITTVQVLHVVSAVEDLAKAAALGKILTKSKMAQEVEGLVQKVVALEVAVGLVAVVVGLAVVVALIRAVVVVLGEVEVTLEEVVVFQEVMMGRMVVAEVVALVVVVDVGYVVKMVTLQETVLKRRVVVEELVIAAVKRDT